MGILQTMQKFKLEKDLRYFLFNRYLGIIGALATAFMVINIINHRPLVNIITAAFIVLLCCFWYILSKYLGKYRIARLSFLVFMTFVYIPFGYWTSPGSTSAMMYLVILAIFMLTFTAVERFEYLFAVVVVIEAIILLHTEIWYPNHYYVYTDTSYRIWDLTINFSVVALAIISTIHYVIIQFSSHNDALYKASITDSLTGLYNRRFFSDFIQSEYNRSIRHEQPFSLVLLDLNNFKRINDVYSHMEGDKVLQDIASIIANNIRNYDVAARFGGDEFVIILPNTLKESAAAYIQRLEKAFTQYGGQYKTEEFSVAFGIEDSRNKSLDDLYRLTDELLYKKKMEQKRKPQREQKTEQKVDG